MKNHPIKRIFSLLLCLAMLLSVAPLTAFAAEDTACVVDGCYGKYNSNGFCDVNHLHYQKPPIVDGYAQIGNVGQLYWFAEEVNSAYGEIKNAVLVNDIVLPTYAYPAIGCILGFEGVFDGQDHIVDFTNVSDLLYDDVWSMFGAVHGTVKNVKVRNFDFGLQNSVNNVGAITESNYGLIQNCVNLGNSGIYHAGNYIGGIVAINQANGIVENCYSAADVSGSKYVGGIVAYNYGLVRNCTNAGSVSAESRYGGGIVGFNTGTIEDCVNNGELPYTSLSAVDIGGITGASHGLVTRCVNNAAVNAGEGNVGGVVGYNDGNVEFSVNNGNVMRKGSSGDCGGIVGQNYIDTTVYGCLNTGDVQGSGNYYNGGIAGYNAGTVSYCGNMGVITSARAGGIVGNNIETVAFCYNGAVNNGKADVCGVVYWNAGDITDSYYVSNKAYYASVTLKAEPVKVSQAQIASGEIAWQINAKVTDGTKVWYQNLDNGETVDAYPVPDATHGTVYKKCNGTTFAYSNDTEGMNHAFTAECDTLCDVCDYVRETTVSHIEKTPASCLHPALCETCGSYYGELAGEHDIDPDTAICKLCSHKFAIKYFPGNTGDPLFTDDANVAINACWGYNVSGTVELLADVTYNGSMPKQIQGSYSTIVFNGYTLTFTGNPVDNYGPSLTLDASKGGTLNTTKSQAIDWIGNTKIKVIGDLVYASKGSRTTLNYAGLNSNSPALDLTEYTGNGFRVKGKPVTVKLSDNYEMRNASTGQVITSLSDGSTGVIRPKHTCDFQYFLNDESTHDKRCVICEAVEVDNEPHTGTISYIPAEDGSGHLKTWSCCGGLKQEHTFDYEGLCDLCKYQCPHENKTGILCPDCGGGCAHEEYDNGFCVRCDTWQVPTLNQDGYYELANAGHLFWFAQFVNAGNKTANAKLIADIDLENRLWTPMGSHDDTNSSKNCHFMGTFDGNNHVVKNLFVLVKDNSEAGFFGRTESATVKNFGIINASVESKGGYRVGVIGGELYKSTVTNVFSAGSITLVTAKDQKGGIAGESHTSTLTNCYTTYGNLTAAGGVSAATNCYYQADAANSASAGTNVTKDQLGSGHVAYLLGEAYGQTIGSDKYPVLGGPKVYQITNCKNENTYSNTDQSVGHIWEAGVCTVCGTACDHSANTNTAAACQGIRCSACGSYYGEKNPDVHDETVDCVNGVCPNGCTVAVASVGETTYTELSAAISAAKETSGTVKLLSSLDITSHVTVADNVTLDLNGHSLKTTGYFTVYGDVIDGTEGGKGIVSAGKVHIMGTRSFLPIYDTAASGYRFYAYQLKNLGAKTAGDNAAKFGIRLELTNTDGYTVLAATTDSKLTLSAVVSWGEEKVQLPYTFKAATLAAFGQAAADKIAAGEAVDIAIILTVTGLDVLAEGDGLYLQPTVTSDTAVSSTATKEAFTR